MQFDEIINVHGTIKCNNAQEQAKTIEMLKGKNIDAFIGVNVDHTGLFIALNGRNKTYLTLNSPATNPQVNYSDIIFTE